MSATHRRSGGEVVIRRTSRCRRGGNRGKAERGEDGAPLRHFLGAELKKEKISKYKVRPPPRSVNDNSGIRSAIVYRNDDSSGRSRWGASPPSPRSGVKGRVPRSEMHDPLSRQPNTTRATARVALRQHALGRGLLPPPPPRPQADEAGAEQQQGRRFWYGFSYEVKLASLENTLNANGEVYHPASGEG